MEIFLNGKQLEVPQGATAADLVELQGLTGKRIAMELNQEIIPRTDYPKTVLSEGDRVEIVHAIGGG